MKLVLFFIKKMLHLMVPNLKLLELIGLIGCLFASSSSRYYLL
jgi:hypothetical protein